MSLKKFLVSLAISAALVFSLVAIKPAKAMDVPLDWAAIEDASLVGYKVYYRLGLSGDFNSTDANEGVSPIDVGNVLSTTLTGLDPTQPYCFKIVGYDTNSIEGPPSNIIRTYQPTSVISLSSDGTYYETDVINLKITFIESVTLNGSMFVTLNTGNTVEITSFEGYDKTFNYTVQHGDNVNPLDVTDLALDPNATLLHTNTSTPITCVPVPIGNNLSDNATLVLITSTLTATTVNSNCND